MKYDSKIGEIIMNPDMLNTNFVWTKDWSDEDDSVPRIVCFRKKHFIETVPAHARLKVSADSRYKLYVNGNFITEGPQKGSRDRWFYDTVDIREWLKVGENAVAVEVLRYPCDFTKRNMSLYRTEYPCLYVEDECDGRWSAKEGYRCKVNRSIVILGEKWNPAPIHASEEVCGIREFNEFSNADFNDTAWEKASPYSILSIPRAQSPFFLKPRGIPAMAHVRKKFNKAVCLRDSEGNNILSDEHRQSQWNELLMGQREITIEPLKKEVVEISADTLQVGYLMISLIGGSKARIKILCSECYSGVLKPNGGATPDNLPIKKDRTDFVNGQLHGNEDIYTVGGFGTVEQNESYEPFWNRTFRFVRLEICTANEPLIIKEVCYRTVGYPLEVKTAVECSDESFDKIWDISLRTLKRCMLETYVDCPFYEQLQYAQDARAEALFTYMVSADDRLARQCMEDLRCAQRSDGLIPACAPSVWDNVIPGFSIYYILMVHDHMMYFGDQDFVKQHMFAIERILDFFDGKLVENGMVGHIGGPIVREPYWSFVDWCVQWNILGGCPPAATKGTGAVTMESLLYLYGLQKAVEMEEFVGNPYMREIYENRAQKLKAAIRDNTLSDGINGISLIQDGPGIDDYSQHPQVFAILTGVVSPEEGKEMLVTVLDEPSLPRCSVAMHPYLFRALEITNMYDRADKCFDIWRDMVKNHLSTCVENDTDARSDCHAWGSAILYELPAVYLGVRPAAPGFSKVVIRPVKGHLTHCKGNVITPKGTVFAEWHLDEKGECVLKYEIPNGLSFEEV